MQTARGTKKLETEYKRLAPIAENCIAEIVNQLNKLLLLNEIKLGFPIQARVKTWDSIAEKLKRLTLDLALLEELQDLIGLRLILLFQRDVETVSGLIQKHFNVIRQYNTSDRLKDDQFGYASTHFILKLKPEWLALPTLAPFETLQIELQLRTIAQHLWAESSQMLQYKREENVPKEIRRSVYRVSALLEAVDLELNRVLSERDDYREDTEIRPTSELNVDLLEKTLDTLLPKANKDVDENYDDLLEDLRHFNIKTVEQLVSLWKACQKRVVKEDQKQVRNLRQDKRISFPPEDEERLNKGVYFTHSGLIRGALSCQFGAPKWRKYTNQKTSSILRDSK
jgi:putative GTP pyrophosphokinase